jgi:hypothetical protein
MYGDSLSSITQACMQRIACGGAYSCKENHFDAKKQRFSFETIMEHISIGFKLTDTSYRSYFPRAFLYFILFFNGFTPIFFQSAVDFSILCIQKKYGERKTML